MRSHKQFDEHMSRFISGFIPLAVTNNLLKYALQELQMRCRARLTTHLLDKYMKGRAYYHVSAVDGRISNPEQLLTSAFTACRVLVTQRCFNSRNHTVCVRSRRR